MKRTYRNLLMNIGVLLCTGCFAFGFAACENGNNGQHTHTYSGTWTTDENYHWYEPTCGDTTVVKDRAEHSFGTDNKCTVCEYEKIEVDEHRYSDWLSNEETHYKLDLCHSNVKVFEGEHDIGEGETTCTICGYTIAAHKHTYGDWTWDTENHWQPATCGDTDEPFGLGAHVDENGDEVCDICPFKYEHIHTESDLWSFNETKHWKTPPCHPNEVLEENSHSFVNGICECGIKDVEVKVYEIYVEREGGKADGFADWLTSLVDAGVTEIRITETGDVVYEYENGTTEIKYLVERTIKVKAALTDGTGIAHVWLKVTMYTNEGYYENGGTTALGLAETDENGIAEITFLPLGGYTSANVEYRIRVAEAKDLAILQGMDEETAKPLPGRCTIAEDSEFLIVLEINESTSYEEIAGQLKFSFSKGWEAYEKFTLPYHRYYTNPLEIEKAELIDENRTYAFTASGSDLFDYFYFTPYFIPAGYEFYNYPAAQAEIIRDNLYNAASGVYKISFEVVEGTANVRLYSWNENRISFNGVYDTKADGTPADKYVNSASGVSPSGTDERYTGGNFVYLTIAPEHAVINFQFGLISDAECKIALTVERIDDYRVDLTPDFVFEIDSEGNGKITNAVFGTLKTDRYINNNIVLLDIEAMSAGTYVLKLTPPSKMLNVTAGSFYARLEDGREYLLWEGGISSGPSEGMLLYKNIVTITDEDTLLYIIDYDMSSISWTITLEKYEPATVTSGAWTYVPSTPVFFGETYQIPLNVAPGTYTIDIRTYGTNSGGESYPFTVNIGNKSFTISGKTATGTTDKRFDYTGTITVTAGDSTISLNCSTRMAVIARVRLTATA